MIKQLMPEVRLLDPNDEPGEILPDVGEIEYMDDSADVGTCTFKYPMKGLRADQVKSGARCCLLLDGEEIPNGKFRLEESSANHATDTDGFRSWVARTDIVDLEGRLLVNTGLQYVDLDSPTGSGWAYEPFVDVPYNPDNNPSLPGQIMSNVINRSNFRRSEENRLRMSFTSSKDSAGKTWAGGWGGSIRNGESALEVARRMSREGIAEARMEHGVLALYDMAAEDNVTTRAEFAVGRNLFDGPRDSSITDLVTALFVKSTGQPDPLPDGWLPPWGWHWIPEMVQKWGLIEGYLETDTFTESYIRRDAENHLRSLAREKSQVTFGFSPDAEDGTIPYQDFGLGDWVLVDIDGNPDAQKVKVITLSWDTDRVLKAGLTCNDRFYENDMARFRRGPEVMKKNGR